MKNFERDYGIDMTMMYPQAATPPMKAPDTLFHSISEEPVLFQPSHPPALPDSRDHGRSSQDEIHEVGTIETPSNKKSLMHHPVVHRAVQIASCGLIDTVGRP